MHQTTEGFFVRSGRSDERGHVAGAGASRRITGASQPAFAATLIGLGILGFLDRDIAAVWRPVFRNVPDGEALAYLSAAVSLACGVGLFWRRMAGLSAWLLLAYLLVWSALFKLPILFIAPGAEVSWQSCGMTAVIVAGAWVLHARLGAGSERRHVRFAARGLHIARALYGLALIAFGFSHFAYLGLTAPLVPGWLPYPVGWAYFTGCTYLAAGLAVLAGVYARLAAVLSAVQMGMFTLLVWVPILVAGTNAFRQGEFVVSWVLTAAAWVVADSYRKQGPGAAFAAQ